MVKIKDGYVMNPREKAEYERMDALPRKVSGTVAYYFKPQTKYPPRIYVFMHAEIWCDRNRRPMGLHTAFPFLTRGMNSEEIEYHHFDTRLCYHQYEDWDKLLYAEEKEAEQLDKENAGIGTEFLDRLRSFREKHPLKEPEREFPPVPPEETVSEEMRYFRELNGLMDTFSVSEIGTLLAAEQQGEKRPLILALLRNCYQHIAEGKPTQTDEAVMQRKVQVAEIRARRNFVRRVYAKNKLFALEEISRIYPGYDEQQLAADLIVKHRKEKRKKHKPVLDLRRCQMHKLAQRLEDPELDGKAYQQVCNRIVLLQNAHDLRLPIPLTVKLQGETLVYDFHWQTRERVVKDFVELANSSGMTHDLLQKKYQEVTSSPASR